MTMNEPSQIAALEQDDFKSRVLDEVKAAGQAGISHSKLVLAKKAAEKTRQNTQVAELVKAGALVLETKGKARRYWLPKNKPRTVSPEELAYETLCNALPEQKRGSLFTLAKIRSDLLRGKRIQAPALRTCLRVLEQEKIILKLTSGTAALYAYAPALRALLDDEPAASKTEPTLENATPESPAQRPGKTPGTPLAVTQARVIEAYKTVRMHRRMPDVEIVRLQEVLQCPVEKLKPVVVQLCDQGVFIPGKGDWSFASPAARGAAILIHNEPYLFVRMKE